MKFTYPIPVKDIAKYFGVSRVTVYNWFSGVSVVSDKHQDRMSELIKKLAWRFEGARFATEKGVAVTPLPNLSLTAR